MSRPKIPVCTGIREVDEIIDDVVSTYADMLDEAHLNTLRELVADVLMTSVEGLRHLDDMAYLRATEASGTQRRELGLPRGASNDEVGPPASSKEHAG